MKRSAFVSVLTLVLVHLGAQSHAAQPKLMVPDVRAVGLESDRVAGLSALVASEASRHALKVVAGSDLAALIGFDRQRQMLGCSDSGCLAELAGALGVDLLLSTEASKVGEVWLLSLTLLDARKNQALRRTTMRAGKADALVELASSGVHEVLQAYPLAGGEAQKAPSGVSGRRILGLALDGAGVAAIAGGVVFGLLASDAHSDANALAARARAGESVSQADFDARWDTARRDMVVADVLYGVGAVALGTGLYFTFTKGAPSSSLAWNLGPSSGGAVLSFSGVLP